MEYLLDTHTLIWFLNGEKDLSKSARKVIETNSSKNLVSIASIWEIAIKINLGKIDLDTIFSTMEKQLSENFIEILPITFQDTLTLTSLSLHHKDPFDRIIISQAINHDFTIITKDEHFAQYKVNTLW